MYQAANLAYGGSIPLYLSISAQRKNIPYRLCGPVGSFQKGYLRFPLCGANAP